MTTPRKIIAFAMNDERMMYDDDSANADTIMKALNVAGFVIVPKNPTIRMKQDGYIAFMRANKTQVYGEAIADQMYCAMIAAAPGNQDTSHE